MMAITVISSCTSNYDIKRCVIKDISQPCNILLCASDTTILPSNVSIHIMGVINGECAIEIENGATCYNTIKLKDTIDFLYNNEWYDSKINLRYIPISMITGDSIVIKYQIW